MRVPSGPGSGKDAPEHTPRRRFGQNFLRDASAARRLVAALAPRPGEAVLEIGPGRGALTGLLIEAAGRVAAVELDRDLAALLSARFDPTRFLLLERDILRTPLDDVTCALGRPAGTRLVVAGNLPFNISKPVVMKLVAERGGVSRAVLTFQQEVAERLLATSGSRAYGPMGVLVSAVFRIERLFDLPPGAFHPRPRVVSTVTRWTPREDASLDGDTEGALRECLAACFAQRRRTLLANLRRALGGRESEARRLLDAAALDPASRAEAVPLEGFLRLALLWPERTLRS